MTAPEPLRVGARGKLEGAPFEVAGRITLSWGDGRRDDWFLLFADGREAWLSGSDGDWALCFAVVSGAVIPPRNGLYPETRIQIGADLFEVNEIRNTVCDLSEGASPFSAPPGRRSLSVELSSGESARARIEYSSDGSFLYLGRALLPEELEFFSTLI